MLLIRDPRTARSVDQPVRFGQRFSKFVWSWSGSVREFQIFLGPDTVQDFLVFVGPGPVRSKILKILLVRLRPDRLGLDQFNLVRGSLLLMNKIT